MRFLPTSIHSVIDYLAVAILMALPRLLGWSAEVTGLLSLAAGATLVYSLLTRYELGLFQWIPMTGHLTLDALSGLVLLVAPFWGLEAPGNQRWWLVGLGLFEIGAALVTETVPSSLRPHSRPVATTAYGDPAVGSDNAESLVARNQVVTDQSERADEQHNRLAANSEPINESIADRNE